MRISIYFTLNEAEYSDTARVKGMENVCSPPALENVRYTASRLDLVRHMIGLPFIVNSWYRCEALNNAVGGTDSSKHVKGLAVDFYTRSNNEKVFKQVIELQKQRKLSFDQCYYDRKRNFIHISFCRHMEDERNMYWIK